MRIGLLERLPRLLFLVSVAIVVAGSVFALGVIAERHQLPPVPQVGSALETLQGSDHPRRHHLQPTRGQGDGVTVNDAPDDGALVLLAGFFDDENQIRLLQRDGTVVHTWPLDYFEHFPDVEDRPCRLSSPLLVDTHGLQITARGEVLFNYEYCGTVKLDACGDVVWRIDQRTHHSIVPAEDGGHWILNRVPYVEDGPTGGFASVFTSAPDPVCEDTILRVSERGEILEELSIPQLLREGGLEALLSMNPASFPEDIIEGGEVLHANKVAELPSDLAAAYPLFDAGDLAISMRGRNLLVVVDPETGEVKWHQIGPWLRQHDPEFRTDGRISIFNNNVYGTAYADGRTLLDAPRATNILAVDPVTGATEVLFGEAPGEEMLSVIRGQHQLLPAGRMLITEFDAGRVLEVDAGGYISWEYVNRYDDEHVGEITDALHLPAGYFERGWDICAP